MATAAGCQLRRFSLSQFIPHAKAVPASTVIGGITKMKCLIPLQSAGRFTIATTSGSVAASVSIRRMDLRRADTSLRDSDIKVPTTAAIKRQSSTSGSCSANRVGRYDQGISGTDTRAPSNISFQGFSKKCEKYVRAWKGLAGSMIDHGQISPITR